MGNLHLKPCGDKTQLLIRADTNLGIYKAGFIHRRNQSQFLEYIYLINLSSGELCHQTK